MPARTISSPLGPLTLHANDEGITALDWSDDGASDDRPILHKAEAQLAEYFSGQRRAFSLPLRPRGARLQRQVCAAMSAIPFGATRTYGSIAADLGVPAQAVGQACGGNSIPILIPCHRVLGADGLGGFSGGTGVETKIWLLRHEGGLLI